jgi:hypothetical protein
MLIIMRTSNRLRLALLGVGILTFLWLGFEDNTTLSVTILGTLIGILVVLTTIRTYAPRIPLSIRVWLPGFVLTGALMGGCAVVFTITLMFFKTAWHSHAFPDYPVPLMADMLTRLPLWMLAGAVIGAGLGLWRWTRRNS